MLNEGKSPTDINSETGIKLEEIEKLYKYILKEDKNIYEVKAKIKKIEQLIKENAKIEQIMDIVNQLPEFYTKKVKKIVIFHLWSNGFSLENIHKKTKIDSKVISEYIKRFEKESQEKSKKSKTKKTVLINQDKGESIFNSKLTFPPELEPIELDGSKIEDDDLYKVDLFKKERNRNNNKIAKIIKKIKLKVDTEKDLQILRKLIETNNVDISIIDELIRELIKTNKINRLKLAEYCNNGVLADDEVDKNFKKRMEQYRIYIKETIKGINDEIKRKSKKGESVKKLAEEYEVDEKYIHEINGLDSWVL